MASDLVTQALAKCAAVAGVIETDEPTADQVARISAVTSISNTPLLISELDADPLGGAVFGAEDEAEEAIETAGAAAAVEMLTIVGSKGLSAKHVIVIGCDDVNMAHTSRLAFFVALTRARESLHLITSLKAGEAQQLTASCGSCRRRAASTSSTRRRGLSQNNSEMVTNGSGESPSGRE